MWQIAMIYLLGLHGGLSGASDNSNALVTICTNIQYCIGATVLAKSFRATNSLPANTDIVLLIPHPSHLSSEIESFLRTHGGFTKLYQLPPIVPTTFDFGSGDGRHNTPGSAKIVLFNLTQYERVLYLDSDSMAVEHVPIFFEDRFWTGNITGVAELDMRHMSLKSGLLALRPDSNQYERLLQLLQQPVDYTNADQGLFNKAFQSEWRNMAHESRIPNEWQLCAAYCVLAEVKPQKYGALFMEMLQSSKLFDFQGASKPWKWPNKIGIKQCERIVPWLYVWLGIAYAPDLEHVRLVLQQFREDRFNVNMGWTQTVLSAVVEMIRKEQIDGYYYQQLAQITSNVLDLPFLREQENIHAIKTEI